MKQTTKVLGVKRIDFTNEDGDLIQGRQIWVCIPSDEPAWNGQEVLKIWVPDSSEHAADAAALIPGDPIEIDFNRRGKPYVVDYVPGAV